MQKFFFIWLGLFTTVSLAQVKPVTLKARKAQATTQAQAIDQGLARAQAPMEKVLRSPSFLELSPDMGIAVLAKMDPRFRALGPKAQMIVCNELRTNFAPRPDWMSPSDNVVSTIHDVSVISGNGGAKGGTFTMCKDAVLLIESLEVICPKESAATKLLELVDEQDALLDRDQALLDKQAASLDKLRPPSGEWTISVVVGNDGPHRFLCVGTAEDAATKTLMCSELLRMF